MQNRHEYMVLLKHFLGSGLCGVCPWECAGTVTWLQNQPKISQCLRWRVKFCHPSYDTLIHYVPLCHSSAPSSPSFSSPGRSNVWRKRRSHDGGEWMERGGVHHTNLLLEASVSYMGPSFSLPLPPSLFLCVCV